MKRVILGLLAAALITTPAFADNYQAKSAAAGNPIITFAAKLFGGILHPYTIVEGQVDGNGSPQPVNVDSSGRAQIVCVSGCSGGGGGGGPVTAASGSYVSGALASGAIVDLGTGVSPGVTTVNGRLSAISGNQATGNGSLATIATNTTGAATSALQTTGNSSLATIVTNTSKSTPTPVTVAPSVWASVPINVSTATTTQLVAASSGKVIYVYNWNVIAGGTGNITLEYGTGGSCGTGTTALTGAYPLIAQAGISSSGGLAPVLVVPASNALCALTSAAVQMSGSVAYAQQ